MVPHNLDPRELVDSFDGLAVACKRWGPRQAHHSRRPRGSEPRPLAALLLESIALRHQIAVLERRAPALKAKSAGSPTSAPGWFCRREEREAPGLIFRGRRDSIARVRIFATMHRSAVRPAWVLVQFADATQEGVRK